MQPPSIKSLRDIVTAGDLILVHTAGRSLADYEADAFFRAGVERCFEVIGEALNRLQRTDPAVADRISGLRGIIGFRNVLAHGYDIVNHARVWRVIEHDLPTLMAEVRALLADAGA